MPIPCILFAAGLDWLENLLPVLFVGFWILSQVFAVFRRVAGNGRPAEPPVVRRPEPARPAPPPMPPEDREQLEQQIEEFLRRVGEGFAQLARQRSWLRLDAARSPDEVQAICRQLLAERLGGRRR